MNHGQHGQQTGSFTRQHLRCAQFLLPVPLSDDD